MALLKLLFTPAAFALGFLTPLIAQTMTALGLQLGDVPNLVTGLAVAGVLALVAHLRGGWLWHSS